jgi:enoyl-CoA hydratase/carnithine racemase
MSDELLLRIDGPVARLVLNRPRFMNAVNLAVIERFERVLPELAASDDVRVLVLTGNGSAFCAGADLKEVLAGGTPTPGEPDFLERAAEVYARLREFPRPVIAALNGLTMAGGLELALCADIVLAAESAQIGDAHSNFGVFPGAGGVAVLPRVLPLNVAMYLLFTGSSLTARQMQQYGFVSEVHPDAELAAATDRLARLLAGKSPAALRRMKEVARHAADMLREHLRSWDLQEGLRAFAEKRAPQFRGR